EYRLERYCVAVRRAGYADLRVDCAFRRDREARTGGSPAPGDVDESRRPAPSFGTNRNLGSIRRWPTAGAQGTHRWHGCFRRPYATPVEGAQEPRAGASGPDFAGRWAPFAQPLVAIAGAAGFDRYARALAVGADRSSGSAQRCH